MRSRNLAAAAGVLLLGAAALLLRRGGDDSAPAAAGQPPPGRREQPSQPARAPELPETTPRNPEPGGGPAAAETRDAILAEIEQLSVTYDAAELPKIEPYLLHPDPAVREAAMNGMIVLGDSAAAPMLRKAAASAPNPREAVALEEAAAYMELPAGTFVPKERTKPGTRIPLGEKPELRRK